MNAFLEARPQLLSRAAAWWRLARKPTEQVLQVAVPAVLLAFIGFSLYRIGFASVWSARPRTAYFYIALVLPFFMPALGDLLIFRTLLKTDWLAYKIFLRKQCLNNLVLDFSGDAYLFVWFRRNVSLPSKSILHAIKDSNILSATAGFVVLCITFLALAASGALDSLHLRSATYWALLTLGVAPATLSLLLILGGRRVTTLSRRDMALTFAIHQTRALAVVILQLLIWYFSGALFSLTNCFEFVALGMVIARVPVLPNKALLYASAAIVAARLLRIPQSGVAAVVVLMNLTSLVLNGLVVGLPWLAARPVSRNAARSAEL